jgi:16S rRNA (uracil1498-N3)-methyltransferase
VLDHDLRQAVARVVDGVGRAGPVVGELAAEIVEDQGGPVEAGALPQARAITLGPRLLRGETAAIAATALWMGIAGGW